MNKDLELVLEQCKGVVDREIPLLVLAPEYTKILLDYINELQQRKDKAMEITKKVLMNSADNRLIAKEEEMEYFDWLDKTLEKQLEILKGVKE